MYRWRAGRCDADRDGVIMDSEIMDVLGDRVLELGPKPDTSGPYRNFKLTRDADGIAWLLFDREGAGAFPRCRRHCLAVVRPRRRRRQYAVGGFDRRTRQGAGRTRNRAACGP